MRIHATGRRGLRVAGLPLALLSLLFVASAHAQQPAATGPVTQTNPGQGRAHRLSIAEALKKISADAGVIALADSTVGEWRIDTPGGTTTPDNVEAQLQAIVDAAGHTATWARLYLPAGNYTGDDVVAFAEAQAHIVGKTVGNAPSGTVEIMGKAIPAAHAKAYIDELGLRPVYVITSSHRHGNSGSQWATMTPEQRDEYAKNTASQLMNSDLATQQAYVQQERAVMRALMTSLSPDQISQLFGPGTTVRVLRSPDGTKQQIEMHTNQITPGP